MAGNRGRHFEAQELPDIQSKEFLKSSKKLFMSSFTAQWQDSSFLWSIFCLGYNFVFMCLYSLQTPRTGVCYPNYHCVPLSVPCCNLHWWPPTWGSLKSIAGLCFFLNSMQIGLYCMHYFSFLSTMYKRPTQAIHLGKMFNDCGVLLSWCLFLQLFKKY